MSEQKITHEDIFDPEVLSWLVEETSKATKAINEMEASIKRAAKALSGGLGVGAPVSNAELKVQNDLIKEQIRLEEQYIKVKKAKEVLTSDEIKNATLLAKQEKEQANATKAKIQASEAERKASEATEKQTKRVTTEYQKQSAELNKLRNAYKDLALAGKENTVEGQKMLSQIQALDTKLKTIDASTGQYQRNVGNYTDAIKGLYGALRVAANIIPGLGISGILLLGWETLSTVVSVLTSHFDENTQAIDDNNKSLERQIEKQKELQTILENDIEDQLVLQGKLTTADKERFQAEREFEKKNSEVVKNKLEEVKKLTDSYKINKEQFDKFGKDIVKFGQLTETELKAISESLKLKDNEGIGGNFDHQRKVMFEYIDSIKEYSKIASEDLKINEEDLNVAVANIHTKYYQSSLKNKKKKNEKEYKEDDMWWRIYLLMWKENYSRLLELYKRDTNEFLKSNEKKFKDAVQRGEDNTKLLIENMQLEASLTKDKIDDENAAYAERLNSFKVIYDSEGKVSEESQKHIELLRKQHKKILADIEKESHDKELSDLKKQTDEVYNALKIELQNKSNLQQTYDQIDIDRHTRNMSVQATLAAEGRQNVLASETAAADKASEKKIQDAKKHAKEEESLELAKLLIELTAAYAKDGNTTNPEFKALATVLVTKGLAAGISGAFWEGSEKIEDDLKGNKMHNGRDGYLIAADGKERILTGADNAKLGGMSNEDLVKNALAFENSYLPVVSIPRDREPMSRYGFMRLESVLNEVKMAIESKPTQSTNLDRLGEWTEQVHKRGVSIVIHHKKTRGKV